jgi:DNA polymerase-3 subunit delta
VSSNLAVWLVDGDDPTLVAEAVRGLVDELVGAGDRSLMVEDMPDEALPAAVADACRTPPFLAERRIVIVREVGRFNTEDAGPLITYLEDPLPTTSLVLVAGGGQTAPKLVAAVKAHGQVRATKVAGRQAHEWVLDRLAAAPLRFQSAAVSALEAHLGEDVSRLGALIAVLVSAYGEGAVIGPDDLEPYLGEAGSVAPWDLTDAIDGGNAAVAIELLHRMLGAGDRHPLVVSAILHRHLGNILAVQSPAIRTEAQAAAALGIAAGKSTFPAKKALNAARKLGPAGAGQAITLLADAELALKGKLDWPPELVLEVLVARLCRLARARAGA